MRELNVDTFSFIKQDIKIEKITPKQLDRMASLAGGYLPLFSKVALKYRTWGLNKIQLSETEIRTYILEEYTFLKRPVFLIGNKIFIGNAPANIKALQAELDSFFMK